MKKRTTSQTTFVAHLNRANQKAAMPPADDERQSRTVDQEAFEKVIRDNLSPAGVAAIIALLQPAGSYRNGTPENERAINQVNWFRDTLLELLELLGVEEHNRLIDEVGL